MNSANATDPAMTSLNRCGRTCMRIAATAWRSFNSAAAWAAIVVLCLPVLIWRLIVDPNDKEDPWRGPE